MREIKNKTAKAIIETLEKKNPDYTEIKIYNTGNMYHATANKIYGRTINRIFGMPFKTAVTLDRLLDWSQRTSISTILLTSIPEFYR